MSNIAPDMKKEISLDIYGRILKDTKSFGLSFSAIVINNLALTVKETQFENESFIIKRNH